MSKQIKVGQPVKLIYMDCPAGIVTKRQGQDRFTVRFPATGEVRVYCGVSLRPWPQDQAI